MPEYTVLATPRSFARQDQAPIALPEQNGCQVIRLPKDGGNLQQQLLEYLPTADGVIAGLENYDSVLLSAAKQLKVISRYGVGVDTIDLAAAAARGIVITNTPGANSDSVADMAIALMLCAARHVCQMNACIKIGQDQKPLLGVEMWQKTLGVIGTGKIGKGVIERAGGFRMKILAYDPYPDQAFYACHHVEHVDIDTLLAQADFVTLHVPLSGETHNLINSQRLAAMKPHAVLVNTARGGLIDEQALFAALQNGAIGAAALDALAVEPAAGNKLSTLPNCILTPRGCQHKRSRIKNGHAGRP